MATTRGTGIACPSATRSACRACGTGRASRHGSRSPSSAGAVRIVRETGKPIAQVARELGINEGTLGNWCARARQARGGADGALTESERAELERLRRENEILRQERNILKRATAFFAREGSR